MIDIEAIKGRIADGICGDDRQTGAEVFDALAALNALVAEVERLRGETDRERAAVVAWLRAEAYLTLYEASPWQVSDAIERGDYRPEVK